MFTTLPPDFRCAGRPHQSIGMLGRWSYAFILARSCSRAGMLLKRTPSPFLLSSASTEGISSRRCTYLHLSVINPHTHAFLKTPLWTRCLVDVAFFLWGECHPRQAWLTRDKVRSLVPCLAAWHLCIRMRSTLDAQRCQPPVDSKPT